MAAALRPTVTDGTQPAELRAHADSPWGGPATLRAQAAYRAPSLLHFGYLLSTQMSRVRLPAASTGGRRDGLWQHSCFEAFLSVPGIPGYYEFNFSPAGDWAAYQFAGYRQGMSTAVLPQPPVISVQSAPLSLELSATVDVAGLPGLAQGAILKLGLAAVLEEEPTGARSYWALRHAPGKPDFHHPEGFALELVP
jgi:hypothetical protein